MLMCFENLQLNGQRNIYQNFTTEDGLPSNTVYRIDQDDDGYIWMATGAGASRYNGTDFTNYGSRSGLKDDIFNLYIDDVNRVWFESFTNYYNYYLDGKIYQTDSIPYLNEKSTKIRSQVVGDSQYLYFTKRSNETTGYLDVVDLNDFSFVKKIPFSKEFFQEDKHIDSLFSLSPTVAIIKPFYYTIINQQDTSKYISSESIKEYMVLRSKNLSHAWFYEKNKNGIYYGKFDHESKTLVLGEKFLEDVSLNCAFIDRSGNYWFGSQANGLFFLPAQKIYSLQKKDGLSSDGIYSLEQSGENDIWLGSNNGFIDKINAYQNPDIQNFPLKDSKAKTIDLMVSKDNYMFGVVESGGVSIVDLDKNVLYHSPFNKMRWKINKTIFHDRKGVYWGGSSGHFSSIIFDKEKKELNDQNRSNLFGIETRTLDILEYKGLNNNYDDDEQIFYLSQNTNILKITFAENDTIFKTFENQGDGILQSGTRGMAQVKDKIWICTVNSGLAILCNDSLVKTINTDSHPISSDAGKKMFYDESEENLWVATNNGVTKISNVHNLDSLTFTNYNKFDGLVGNEATDVLVDKNGWVWVSTKAGLSYFKEDTSAQKMSTPKIKIKNVLIWDKDTTILNDYQLKHSQNDLSFELESIYFNSPVKFKYKLSGRDPDWIISKNGKIRYSQLPIGDYSFTALAINEDFEQSKTPVTIKFSILPPFWKTWWFLLGSLLLLGSLVFLIVRYQLNQLKVKNNLAELSMKGIRSQMNAHFVFNALNAIQSFLLNKDIDTSYTYLAKLAKLIRQTLYHSNQPAISIQDEIAILKTYMDLENLRLKTGFIYDIKIDEEISEATMSIQPMMLQPYIENSIRWGFKELETQGLIKINLELYEEKYIKCSIVDNGIGRQKANEIKSKYFKDHKSMGTEINNERVKLLEKLGSKKYKIKIIDLYNDQKVPLGTKVELLLPLENKNVK